jgi:hypothetical protein
LAISVNENRVAATLVHSVYPGDEGFCLIRLISDPDGVGFVSNTLAVADVDIVIARGEKEARARTHCDIMVADGVLKERAVTDGRIVVSRGVLIERVITDGRVVGASGVVTERLKTDGRIAGAFDEVEESGIALSRVLTWIASVWVRTDR